MCHGATPTFLFSVNQLIRVVQSLCHQGVTQNSICGGGFINSPFNSSGVSRPFLSQGSLYTGGEGSGPLPLILILITCLASWLPCKCIGPVCFSRVLPAHIHKLVFFHVLWIIDGDCDRAVSGPGGSPVDLPTSQASGATTHGTRVQDLHSRTGNLGGRRVFRVMQRMV